MEGCEKSTNNPFVTGSAVIADRPKVTEGVVVPLPGFGIAVLELSLYGTLSLPHVAATTYLLFALKVGPSLIENQQYEDIV